VLWGTMLGCGKAKLDGSVSCRDHGGALGALDRGWEATWAADDGGQRLRRRSGEVWCSGEKMAREMQTRESKRECVGSSRMCSGSRRRRGHARAGAGKPAGVVAARAAAAQRGEAGKGQREAGKAAGKAQEGTLHGLERREGGRCMAHGHRVWRGVGQRKQSAEGWR
jgi:hypothetical protein